MEGNDEDEVRHQNIRIFRDRDNPLENMSDESFQYRYRITKEVAHDLCAVLNDDLNRATRRSQSLPPSLQILIAIRYFATGSFQRGNADIHGVHRTTVCKVIHKAAEAICGKANLFIKFPREQREMQTVKEQFYIMSNFPNILGAIDGTNYITICRRTHLCVQERIPCHKCASNLSAYHGIHKRGSYVSWVHP